MNYILWLLIIELSALIIYLTYLARKKVLSQEEQIQLLATDKLPYKVNRYTLNEGEKIFFRLLESSSTITGRYYIFPQLHLGKLLYIPKDTENQWVYLNQIERKSVDFTLFDKQTFQPKLVIELDGDPHVIDQKVRARDKFINEVFLKAQLPILHVPRNDKGYSLRELEEKIRSKISN